jgi:FMN phosphatase YigB (HAD superfamily)
MKTDRLDKKEVLDLVDGGRFEKIFLDVDYTVLDFDAGSKKGIERINKFIPKIGGKIGEIYSLILRGKRGIDNLNPDEQTKFTEIMREMELCQPNIAPSYGIKHWSRETMAIVAAKELGLKLKAKQIKQIRQIFWRTVAKYEKFYSDAIPFLEKIKKEGIKIIWVTGSDSVLKVRQGENRVDLEYDSEYSWRKKSRRLKMLLKKYPGELVIGDPIEKPVLWENLLKDVDIKKILIVGDSYETDIRPAEEMGVETILIRR